MIKTILVTFIALLSLSAQARNLEATVSCDCAQWVLGSNNNMELKRAHTGASMFPEFTDKFALQLITSRWEQRSNTKAGYVSVTPGFLEDSQTGFDEIFKNGSSSIDYLTSRCNASADSGLVACGISITFPINENAKKMQSEL